MRGLGRGGWKRAEQAPRWPPTLLSRPVWGEGQENMLIARWTMRPVPTPQLDWAIRFARDPQLLEHYEVEVLPALSVANVPALLRAALPLPQLLPDQAAALVVKHLDNRTRSRQSRLKNRSGPDI